MKKLYLLFLIFIASFYISQNDSSFAYKNQIKLSPLRIIGLDPGIELSYEREFSSDFSMQITGRYLVNIFENTSLYTFNNLNGYAFYLEPKYYLKTSGQSRTFVSAKFGYVNSRYKIEDNFLNPHADTINKLEYDFIDTVIVNRKLFDIAINYGVQKYYKKFVFEFSAGLGIRYRETTLGDKLYPYQQMIINRHQIFGGPNDEGYFFSPLIPLRFKIGYRF